MKARKGILKGFTGVSDPYEEPLKADIIVESSEQPPEKIVDYIYDKIKEAGYLS